MEKQFIDIAYDVARTKYSKKAFTFEQLWTDFVKKAKLDAEEQKKAGEVYTALLQDIRFIFIGKGQWKLRENLTLDEQMQLSNALYDFNLEAEEEGEEAQAAKRRKASEVVDEDMYYDEETLDEMYQEKKQQLEDETDDESDEEDDGSTMAEESDDKEEE